MYKPALGLRFVILAQVAPSLCPPSRTETAYLLGQDHHPWYTLAGSLHSGFEERPVEGGASIPLVTLPQLHSKREVKAQVPATHDLQTL